MKPHNLLPYGCLASYMNRLKFLNIPYEHFDASPEIVFKKVNDQLAQVPNHYGLLRRKAHALSQTEDLGGAMAILNELVRAKPHRVNAILDRAQILIKLGRFEDAVSDALSAAEASSSDIAVHLMAANLLLRLGRSDAAVGCYKSYWNLINDAQLDYRWGEDRDFFEKASEPVAEAIDYCVERAGASTAPATEAAEWLMTARRLYSVVDVDTPEPTRSGPTPAGGLWEERCDTKIREVHIRSHYSWRKEIQSQLAVIEARVAWRHGARDTTIIQLHGMVQAELHERGLSNCGVITTCTSEGKVQVVEMRKTKGGSAEQMLARFAEVISNFKPCNENTRLDEAILYSLLEVDANGAAAIAQAFVREDVPAEIAQAGEA